LRDFSVSSAGFRQHVDCLATLLAYEVTRDLPLQSVTVQTPLEATAGSRLRGRLAIVPILRAGLGMTGCCRTHRFGTSESVGMNPQHSRRNTTRSCRLRIPPT
jgi:uracil phosphoribosyltransferase